MVLGFRGGVFDAVDPLLFCDWFSSIGTPTCLVVGPSFVCPSFPILNEFRRDAHPSKLWPLPWDALRSKDLDFVFLFSISFSTSVIVGTIEHSHRTSRNRLIRPN